MSEEEILNKEKEKTKISFVIKIRDINTNS